MISDGTALSTPGESRGWSWLVVTAALVVGAAVLLTGLFSAVGSEHPEKLGWDLREAYLPAAELVLHGHSPYPADPADPALVEQSLYAYPPQLAFLVAPLTVLPEGLAAVVGVLALFAALMGALALVGVRDIRCYAAVVIWAPTWNALETANVSALLALMLALVWRYRQRLWPCAAALGAMVSLKLFLWPLLVWAAATRRLGYAVVALVLGLMLTAAASAVIGLAWLRTYVDVLERVATQQSYSLAGMADALGLGSFAASLLTLAVLAGLLVLCVSYARRGDDARAFLVAVVAALATSPIVWLHYLVLLAVPLAVLRPRFSALWLLPIILWISPRSGTGVGIEHFVPALVTVVLVVLLLTRPPYRSSGSAVAEGHA